MNYVRQYPRFSFKDWFFSPIECDKGFLINKENKFVTHGRFIESFAEEIEDILSTYNFYIENKEKFLDELIDIIYSVSDNSSYGPI